jgi:hypothetical protein
MKVLHRAMIHRLQGRYLFLFVDHRSGADMQHARRIANATGVHRHIDDLLLDLRRLTGVALHQQKGPSTPREAHTAPIALLAFRRQTMLDNIGPLAIRAVQHLRHHRCSFSHGWFSSAQTSTQDNRSTALKHLPVNLPSRDGYSPASPTAAVGHGGRQKRNFLYDELN